ncbi:hypothetical protein [Photobacterium damselae]
MKTHNVVYLTAIIALLQGCALQMPIDNDGAAQPPKNGYEEVNKISSNLKTCLFEANQLKHINKNKYNNQVYTLYKTISEVKYYTSIYKEINKDTKTTITPLYTYRINNLCNSISQSLMSELEKGVLQKVVK